MPRPAAMMASFCADFLRSFRFSARVLSSFSTDSSLLGTAAAYRSSPDLAVAASSAAVGATGNFMPRNSFMKSVPALPRAGGRANGLDSRSACNEYGGGTSTFAA